MRGSFITAIALLVTVSGCTSDRHSDDRYSNNRRYQDDYSRYDWNNPGPSGHYYADRYYRDDRRYNERQLSFNDRIYRGSDGQYYCRRSNGTTGLIIGGITGGILGNMLSPGGSEVLGTIAGAAGGAVIGSAIERGEVRCR